MKTLPFQASFEKDSLISKWKESSNESLIFNLFQRHENEEKWFDVVLKNVYKNDRSSEYKVEYTISNAQPGRYTCQIQSRCEFGMSGKSEETSVYKEEEVRSVILGPIFFIFKTSFSWLDTI